MYFRKSAITLGSCRSFPCCVHYVSKPSQRAVLRCRAESLSVSNEVPDPANTILSQTAVEVQPLVTQFEAERNDEDRETFVTAEGLVEEVEEEDAKVLHQLISASVFTTMHT